MSGTTPTYDPAAIEAARQAAWAECGAFRTAEPGDGRRSVYVKPSSPFTSGNLHMGHVRDYAIGDAYARFRRGRGEVFTAATTEWAWGLVVDPFVERITRNVLERAEEAAG